MVSHKSTDELAAVTPSSSNATGILRLSDALEAAKVSEGKTVEAALMPLPEEGRQHRYRARMFRDFGDAGPMVTRPVTIAEPCSRSYRTILEPPGERAPRSRRVRFGSLFAKNNPATRMP